MNIKFNFFVISLILFYSIKTYTQNNQYHIYDIDYFEHIKRNIYRDYLNINNIPKDSIKAIFITKEITIKDLKKYKNLEYIYIKGCKIKNVPKYGKKLKFIKIEKSKLVDNSILEHILNKKELLSITIKGTNIKHFYWLKEFKNLKKLILNKIKLKNIPDVIFNLKKLEILSLENNKIKNISKMLFTLKKLKVIYLMKNKIRNLSYSFKMLDSLKVLDLSYNPINNKQLCKLMYSSIEVLYCKNCKLTTFPICLKEMAYLQIIDISKNKILSLPNTLKGFVNLWFIQVDMSIKYIPDFYIKRNIFISKI